MNSQKINWQEVKRKSKIGVISGLLAIPVVLTIFFLSPSLGIYNLFFHGDRLMLFQELLIVLPLLSYAFIGAASGFIYKSKALIVLGFFIGLIPFTIILLAVYFHTSVESLNFIKYSLYLTVGMLIGLLYPWRAPKKLFISVVGGLVGQIIAAAISWVFFSVLLMFALFNPNSFLLSVIVCPFLGGIVWYFIALAEEKYNIRSI